MTVLTIDEVAVKLKMTRSQLYSLTRNRARQRMDLPIPYFKVNGNIRFLEHQVDEWLKKISEEAK